jgi:hypothetical protein
MDNDDGGSLICFFFCLYITSINLLDTALSFCKNMICLMILMMMTTKLMHDDKNNFVFCSTSDAVEIFSFI